MAHPDTAPQGHERIETSNSLMIVLILVTVAIGGLVEIVPLFFQRSTTQPVDGLKPYSALQLAGRGPRSKIAAMAAKFPTAALACFRVDATRWADLAPDCCELVRFVVPAELED